MSENTTEEADAPPSAELQQRWMQPDEDGRTRGERMREGLERLRAEGGRADEPFDLRGIQLHGIDLRGVDLSGSDLSGADLSGADLSKARLFRARLAHAVLFEATLEDTELAAAELVDVDLRHAKAARAGFGNACLDRAQLLGARLDDATLADASLQGADLRACEMTGVRACGADLSGADLSRAVLRNADLRGARVDGAHFEDAQLAEARMERITGFRTAHWIGTRIQHADFTGAYLCRRHIEDENYLFEFKAAWPTLHRVWWMTSDCGRSVLRWGLWIGLFAVLFALAYSVLPIDYGDYETALSPLYFSVVTFTTLGYGDALPSSPLAQLVTMVQVSLGYVMLGGLLSIFSDKMARRAG